MDYFLSLNFQKKAKNQLLNFISLHQIIIYFLIIFFIKN